MHRNGNNTYFTIQMHFETANTINRSIVLSPHNCHRHHYPMEHGFSLAFKIFEFFRVNRMWQGYQVIIYWVFNFIDISITYGLVPAISSTIQRFLHHGQSLIIRQLDVAFLAHASSGYKKTCKQFYNIRLRCDSVTIILFGMYN